MRLTAKDRLIVALDVEGAGRALDLFHELRDLAGMFKVGPQLFTANGPDVVRQIVAKGGRVFLDLKFHDIPNTVAAAASQAASLGVSILNLHALGGAEMMKRAVAAVEETATSEGLTKPKVIAVTLLTSLDIATLGEIGIEREPGLLVTNLARAAQACGLDGVVASAHEIGIIRGAVRNPDFLIVTPGIRGAARTSGDDQRRVMTAGEAVRAGADYVVVGRPILHADDPVEAATKIVEEIDAARS